MTLFLFGIGKQRLILIFRQNIAFLCRFSVFCNFAGKIYRNMILLEKSVKFGIAASIEYSAGGIISRQIVRNTAGRVTLFSFDEGQTLSEHTSSFDEIIQILEGEAKVIIDGKVDILTAGEAVIMPANVSHALNAVTKFKMILITIKG
jgi:quercetin dioxygenase-like cupin family protein